MGEREERTGREGQREDGERERREESQERGEKRTRTDTDTDVESTQSRQKKGQMKSIFLSDSDEDTIAEFINSMRNFMTRLQQFQRQAEERKTLGAASSYPKLACQDCEEVV